MPNAVTPDDALKVMEAILSRCVTLAKHFLPENTSVSFKVSKEGRDVISISIPNRAATKDVHIAFNKEGNISIFNFVPADTYNQSPAKTITRYEICLFDPASLEPTFELKVLSSFL